MKNMFLILLMALTVGAAAQSFESVVQHNDFAVAMYQDNLATAPNGKYAIMSEESSDKKSTIRVYDGQTIDWEEEISATIAGRSGSLDFDETGNLYSVSCFVGNTTLPNGTILAFPNNVYTYLLTKWDATGNIIWNVPVTGGAGCVNLQIFDLKVKNEKIIFGGNFNGYLHNQTGYSNNKTGFICMYDTTGTYMWIRKIDGQDDSDRVTSVDFIGMNIVATGEFLGANTNFGNGQFESSNGANDYFISYYDQSGNTQWVAKMYMENAGSDVYPYLACSESHIFISGRHQHPQNTCNEDGTIAVTIPFDASNASQQSSFAKYDTLGNVLWATTIPGTSGGSEILGYGIDVNDEEDVLWGGSLNGGCVLKYLQNGDSVMLGPTTNQDILMLKIAGENGDVIWGHSFVSASGGDLMYDIEYKNNEIFSSFIFNDPMDIDHGPSVNTIQTSNGQFGISRNLDHNQWYEAASSNDWADSSNWAAGHPPCEYEDVVVTAGTSNFPTITSTAECDTLLLEEGASLIGQDLLTVNGTARMGKTFAGYTSSTDGWNLVSAPVTGMEIAGSDFEPGSGDDFYAWDEPNTLWRNFKDGTNPPAWFDYFDPGTGYLIARENTETLYFKGKIGRVRAW